MSNQILFERPLSVLLKALIVGLIFIIFIILFQSPCF